MLGKYVMTTLECLYFKLVVVELAVGMLLLDGCLLQLTVAIIIAPNWGINLCLEKGRIKIQVRIEPDIFSSFS